MTTAVAERKSTLAPLDLVEYLSLASTGTGQSTFYNKKYDQEQALADLHDRIIRGDRRIYAITSVFPINDKSKQLVIKNLLSTAACSEDTELEDHAIRYTLDNMPFNRILNLLVDLANANVNNSRTRRLAKEIWEMCDAFRVIKYRDKLHRILSRNHIGPPIKDKGANKNLSLMSTDASTAERQELHRWIFGQITKPEQVGTSVKLRARLEAPKVYERCFDLPLEIGEAIAMKHHGKTKEDYNREHVGTKTKVGKGKTTRKETLRARKTTARAAEGETTVVDFTRFSLIELLSHLYRQPEDWDEIAPQLDAKAKEMASRIGLPSKVAVVVDNSASSQGSKQRELHPLAVIESTARVCKALEDSEVECYYVGPEPTKYLKAEGPSDLRMPLARALSSRPDLVLILSDGYENVRAGSVTQILNTRAVKNSGIAVIHMNPVAAAETGNVRVLSEGIPTYGLSSPELLPMSLLLGQAATNPELLEPIFARIEQALKVPDYKAARLAATFKQLPAPVA